MKSKLTLALVALMLFLGSAVKAQNYKFGHINTQEVLMALPERADAEKKIQAYAKELEDQLKIMNQEYQTKVTEYQSKEATYTDLVKKSKIKEITDLEGRIQEFQQNADQELKEKQQQLLQPMIEKTKKAIDEVAKEGKYSYIFDASAGSILYSPESDNILSLVKKKLGIN
jgi:outer membrane protein